MHNSKVRCSLLVPGIQSLEQDKLRWLRHILFIVTERLPRCTLQFKASKFWRMDREWPVDETGKKLENVNQ